MTLKIGYEPIKGDSEDDSCDHSDNDDTQDEEEFSNPEVYTEEEMEAVEGHIQQYFGKFENVFHEIVPRTSMWTSALFLPLRSVTITHWLTMGMGAHRIECAGGTGGIQAGTSRAGHRSATGLETGVSQTKGY